MGILPDLPKWKPGGGAPIPKGDTTKEREAKRAVKLATKQRIRKEAEVEAKVEAKPTVRKPIGDRQRFRILHRFKHTCVYCGAKAGDPLPDGSVVKLHIDHKVSVKDGGDNSDENLVAACNFCNFGKGRKSVR